MTSSLNDIKLNKEQQQAVDHFTGPCLVTAVPGSGKTSTLTTRVIKLMERGVSPRSICCITFTNKAAQEMKERICALDPHARKAWISTYHRLCVRILRKYGHLVGLREGFSIYDDDDTGGVMTKAHRMWAASNNEDAKIDPQTRRALKSRIDDLRESAKPFDLETEDERLAIYLQELCSDNAVDFSGMLYLTWKILSKNQKVCEKLTKRFEFVLIDEAQDTNDIQYEIAKLIAAHGNLFMVGDFQQCAHEDENIPILKDGEVKLIRAGDLPPSGEILSYKNKKIVYSPYICQKSSATRGFKIITESGASLSVSSRHKMFSTGLEKPDGFILYLMFRPDKGFRVGITAGANLLYGNRTRQEGATKLWVLDILPDRESALIEEQKISLTFGVPTYVFNAENRGINQDRVNKVFSLFGQNGKSVLDFYDLDFDKPLWAAQSKTTNTYKRNNICLTAHNTKGSTVVLEWSDSDLNNIVENLGFSVKAAKETKNTKRWRCRKLFTEYKEAEKFAERLASVTGSDIQEKLKVGRKCLNLTTASAIRVGCYIPIKKYNELTLERVEKIKPLTGNFVSLDVNTGVFFNGSGILSHNSVYSFRGANPENLNKFIKDFPKTVNIVLPRNYRSRSEILDKAINVIHHNDDAKSVKLIAERGPGGAVHIDGYDTEWEEAEAIASKLKRYNKNGYAWKDMAVIYRLNKLSQAFEISLAQNGIPYQTKGGQSFFSRREIKTALAYLRILINPADSSAFAQAIANPKRGVGDTLLGQIDLLSREDGITVTDAATKVKIRTKLARSGIDTFLDLLEQKRKELKSGKSLMVVADELLKESGYHYQLCQDAEDEKEGPRSLMRIENLEKFIEGIGDFEEANSNPSMQKFLQQIALVQDGDNNKNPDSVSLMTMHASKGLEFPVVFVAGVNYEIVPHIRSVEERKEPEERRLFYVALTRAKDQLHVSFPLMRRRWNKMIDIAPSPYLQDMLGVEEDKNSAVA